MPKKLKLTAHGQHNVFSFGRNERAAHVWMKVFIWALYLPAYPDLDVEVRVGDRYKPDVVAVDPTRAIHDVNGAITFWGESGRVSQDKIASLVRRYPSAHFALAKWEKNLRPIEAYVREAVADVDRTAPFDLLRFAPGDPERFIDASGTVTVRHDDIEWMRIEPTG